MKHRKLFALSTFLILWFVIGVCVWNSDYERGYVVKTSVPLEKEEKETKTLEEILGEEFKPVAVIKEIHYDYKIMEWLPPVIGLGLVLTIIAIIIGLACMLFLYNIYLAICSIFKIKNKLELTIYDGIAFGSIPGIIVGIIQLDYFTS